MYWSMSVCAAVCRAQGVTYVHDAVLVGVEEQPIVEECQLGVGRRHIGLQTNSRGEIGEVRRHTMKSQGDRRHGPSPPSYRAGGEQPTNDGPAR